jgi:hypothetical protein
MKHRIRLRRMLGHLLLVAVSGLASYILIPVILSRYNDTKSLRDARMAKAIRFGDYNDEFDRKINGLRTLMLLSFEHDKRMNGADLKETKKDLSKALDERYQIDLDASMWWWPQDFQREVATLKLLSPGEITRLAALIQEYNKSLDATLKGVRPLWHFMDSPDYKFNDENKKRIDEQMAICGNEIEAQRDTRNNLVREISTLFLESDFRTRWRDMVIGF